MNIRFLILIIPFIFTGFFIDKLYFTYVLVTFCTYTIISITTSCEQVTKVATDKALPLCPNEIGRWNRKPCNILRLACPSINNDSRCKKYQVFFIPFCLEKIRNSVSVRPYVMCARLCGISTKQIFQLWGNENERSVSSRGLNHFASVKT